MSVQAVEFTSPEPAKQRMAKVAAGSATVQEPVVKPRTDSNKFTDRAKQLVVDNYNSHHDSSKTPPLTVDLVYIIWYAKVLDGWKAMVGSSVVRGLIYEVTYNGARSEAYVDVYKKINNVKIAD
jgi:hypothetical protein